MADSAAKDKRPNSAQQAAPKKDKHLQEKLARALRTNLQRRKQAQKSAPHTAGQG